RLDRPRHGCRRDRRVDPDENGRINREAHDIGPGNLEVAVSGFEPQLTGVERDHLAGIAIAVGKAKFVGVDPGGCQEKTKNKQNASHSCAPTRVWANSHQRCAVPSPGWPDLAWSSFQSRIYRD